MRHLTTLFAALSFVALAGCAGDPELDGADTSHGSSALEFELDRSVWEAAPAGCEDVDPRGMTLAGCEGEPLLGALVDPTGRVACVDALSLLLVEVAAVSSLEPASADPSPQPSHPGMEDDDRDRIVATESPDGDTIVPVMGGGVRQDPTPTPIVQPLREDPTPTPITEPRPYYDPTPTPVMPQ